MAHLAHKSGKAIITYKLGKSDLGKELAKSHTGAIAGSDEAFNAFIKYNGMSRVEIFETLIEVPNLFKNKTIAKGKRIGIATTTGGGGAMVVESISNSDIEVINPGPSMSKLMKQYNIPYNDNKLVDLTIAGAKPEIVNDVIKEFMDNKNCDLKVNLRCARFSAKEVQIFVGGGITSQSNPNDEFKETEIKSQTLLSVIKKK